MSGYVIMGRTLARVQAMQLLFQAEATGRSVENVLAGDFALSEGPLEPFARELALGAADKIDEIDERLNKVSTGWDVARMPAADRNLLRVATWEMLWGGQDVRVAIDEAVELAKRFGTDESAGFINGVLGGLVRAEKLDEPAALIAEEREAETDSNSELLIDSDTDSQNESDADKDETHA